MRARTASSDIVARGFKFDGVSLGLAQKYMNGSMTAADIIREIESTWGSVGIWWGSIGPTGDDFYGSAEQAREYAGWSGDGSIEHRWEDMLDLTGGQVDPSEWMEADIRVVLIAKKPMRDYGIWNPTTENGDGSIWESTSFFNEGERLELVEVHYAADRNGNDWKVERVSGLTVTAQDYFMNHRPAGPDYGGPMHDVSEFFPDITTLPVRIYDFGEPGSQGSIRQIIDAQGNPGKPVTIYRTVPKGVTTSIRSGDWVTISREYAEQHGRSNADGNYDVLSATVSAQDLWTSGDSVNEWGYHGPELRTAGTEYAPGPVYRGINTDMLTDDELDEIEEWAEANAYSQNNYQLAEPNYGLIHRIVDRLERNGLGRHWSKDYDVSASFAQDQGDNIAIIFIGDWDGQGVDDREFHRGWDGVQRPSNVEHEKEVTLMPGSRVTLVGVDVVMPTGFTSNIPVPTIQVTATRTAADLPPGLRMENPKPNQVVAYDDGNPSDWHARFGIGVLSWDDDGVITWVGIQGDEYHRRGIATAMLEYARTIRPDIKHSDELSESGAGWAQAVGFRTAAVDYLLQKLLNECETSETSYHDHAILQSFMTFPEEVLDTHPFAWELKKCQKEAGESEYPETDNVLVEWLIEINEKGKDHQSRTAANDLRVHLFDSEGHEMFLEPDFEGNPWTYHPKVMEAVRFLADVAQSNGVYWHMDHNEWIPSTITDFKVYDGSNDVTHEIKEFPQLRGHYASRTTHASESLETVIDYARDNVYDTLAENGLDIHDPEAYDLIQETWRSSLGMYEDMYGLEIPQDVYERYASRTAAEPGGVLPWNPSHRGYTWITKADGTLEAVTNDGVNRMYLHDEGYGWTWEVFDNIGLVERGNFGTALKGGDALRDRANDLLAEFDTRAERRTRGPSWGYQDDYTQAPNTLWGRRVARKTTSQRYAERLRKEGRR